MLPIVKRRKGCQQYPEQGKDEQAVSQSSLNKLVGAVDAYNLEVCDVLFGVQLTYGVIFFTLIMFLIYPNTLGDGTAKLSDV